MLKRNGIGIGIGDFSMLGRKKPCLYIYDEKTNQMTKVATFNSKATADWFERVVDESFLKGMIEGDYEDDLK